MPLSDSEGQKRLVAYVCTASEAKVTVEQIRHQAKQTLPEYMVPAAIVFLDAFPLTPSGKVDRKALPAAEIGRTDLGSAYEAPATEAEEALAAVWSDVLRVERIGVHDNFFALGGDSILSIQVVAGSRQRGYEISLADVFQHQTVRELARHAKQLASSRETDQLAAARCHTPFALLKDEDAPRMPADVEDAYPLARLQAGMLFHAQMHPEQAIYSNLTSLHLRVPFEETRFQAAIDCVVARHAVLRTSFDLTSYSEPLQLVHRDVRVPLAVHDLRRMPPEAQHCYLQEWIEQERCKDFDTNTGPLLRFCVHRRSDDEIQSDVGGASRDSRRLERRNDADGDTHRVPATARVQWPGQAGGTESGVR